MRTTSLLPGLLLAATISAAPAASIALNISMGYLLDAGGASAANRLPADTLLMLVADMGGDGFDPVPADSWVGGTDIALMVYDSEFPAASGGTRGFDLASGSSESGLFSRTLLIDTAQFGDRTGNLTLALRWFPNYKGNAGLPGTGPGAGASYGQFSRSSPLYGLDSWTISLTPGASYTLDPFASPELGGTDPAAGSMANFTTVPEPSAAVLLLLFSGLAARHRRGGAS
ncbi:MAG: hypothetical protein V4726_10775 [Verrucomicrobiota bacterium]